MRFDIPLGIVDYALILALSPLFILRFFHWVIDRHILPNSSACSAVDYWRVEFSNYLSLTEIRPGRLISVMHLPPLPDGPRIGLTLFAHGSCARMQQFVHQIRYFWKEGYEIVAYDALGCGESAKPVGANLYSSEEMYRDFEAVVRHFTCDRSRVACAVIGHSFGGALVSKLSASMDAPKLTRCAVSICQPVDDGSFKKQSSIFKLPISVLWLIRPLLGIKARSLLLGPKATPALYEQEKEASARNPVHMFKSFYMGIAPGFLRIANFEPNRVPLLLLAGDVDKICPLERIRKLKDHLGSPQVRLEQVQNCGHQCMQEDPEQVNGMIEKFLQ